MRLQLELNGLQDSYAEQLRSYEDIRLAEANTQDVVSLV
jgi:hypothetical protein